MLSMYMFIISHISKMDGHEKMLQTEKERQVKHVWELSNSYRDCD